MSYPNDWTEQRLKKQVHKPSAPVILLFVLIFFYFLLESWKFGVGTSFWYLNISLNFELSTTNSQV